jgi:hypothetical protein
MIVNFLCESLLNFKFVSPKYVNNTENRGNCLLNYLSSRSVKREFDRSISTGICMIQNTAKIAVNIKEF